MCILKLCKKIRDCNSNVEEKKFCIWLRSVNGEGVREREMSLYGGFVHDAGWFDISNKENFLCATSSTGVAEFVAEFDVKISSRL